MAETALSEQEPLADYALIVATATWPLVLLALDGTILALSAPAQKLLGAAAQPGRPFAVLFAPEHRAELSAILGAALDGDVALARVALQGAGGQDGRVEVELHPVLDVGAPLVAAAIYPQSLAHRRSQLILECNLLTPRLLQAQTVRDVYAMVSETLKKIGFGLVVLELAGDGATLRLSYDTSDPLYHGLLQRASGAHVRDVAFPASASPLAEIIAGRRAIYEADALAICRAVFPAGAADLIEITRRIMGLRGFIYAPLTVGDAFYGIMVVWGQLIDCDDVPFVEAFAHQVGAALSQIELRRRTAEQFEANVRLYSEAEATRRYLHAIIQHTPDAMIVCRPDMSLRPLNPSPLAAVGYRVADLEGRPFLCFFPEEHHDEVRRRWQAVLAGEAQRFEMELLHGEGRRISALISADLIPGYDEVLVIVKDITELRRLEAHYRQSEKLAAIGRLVAGAAHELNNPLAVILGLAQLQLLEELPPHTREDIVTIERSARRAAAIVQQLRIFSRPQPLKPQPVDIGAIARDVLARLSAPIASSAIVTSHVIDREPLLAAGEPHQIELVLFHIIQNAIQALAANPAGAPRELTIRGGHENGSARLSIGDSGPGISPEHLLQVFEPFFTTRDVGQGLGLGLTIVHAIVQQHGGAVWVESTQGRGTVFELQLPAAQLAPQAARAPAQLPPGTRILIVEDEAMARSVAERTLGRMGCEVVVVSSGGEALDRALAEDYALIISDLQVLGLSGPALYERLRRERPGLRWLIIADDTADGGSRAFLERTGLPVLVKPFTHEQLLQGVAECLIEAEERRSHRDADQSPGDPGAQASP